MDPQHTILVVDDSESYRQEITHLLSDAGYRILMAEHGRQAVSIMSDTPVDILVTGLSMPGMNGINLCRKVRSFEGIGFCYIILMTTDTHESTVVEGLEAGADDFLRKPFNHAEFLARIRAGMRIVQLQHDLARQTREFNKQAAKLEVANHRLENLNEQLEFMAKTDELTGLGNRRAAMTALQHAWNMELAEDQDFSCILSDIDRFKTFNDTHGHDVGDRILKEASALMRSGVPSEVQPYRLGGEEFLMLCPDMRLERASDVAEAIREHLASHPFDVKGKQLHVTMSFGVASRGATMAHPDELINLADRCMYRAKELGRNRVMASTGLEFRHSA